MVSDLEARKPRHNVVGWPAPGTKNTEQHLVKVVNHSGFRCLNISKISTALCQSLFPLGSGSLSHYATRSVVRGPAILASPGAC